MSLYLEKKVHIMRCGHNDVIMDPGSKMEARTSYMAAYISPKSPEVRLYGIYLFTRSKKKLLHML